MEQVKSNNPLATEPVGKLMKQFAIPSIIAMMVGAIYNIVDQLFIGQYVGTLGNAATNVAFPLSTSCIALALLFGIGAASAFNLAMGRGEKEEAAGVVGNAITMLLGSGIVLGAVTLIWLTPLLTFFGAPESVMEYAKPYVRISAYGFPFLIVSTGGGHLIRADGSPKMTMICNLSGAIINVVLDALFISVFKMGMAGAAYATIIGQIFSGILTLGYLFRFKTVKIGKKQLLPKATYILQSMSLGTASCFNQIAMMVVQIVLNKSFTHYGALSSYGQEIPLACAGIAMKVSQLYFSFIIGIAQGTQPIESFNYGAKKYDRVKQAYYMAMKAGAVIAIISFALFQLFPNQILRMFGTGSDAYFTFGCRMFRIFLFFTFANFLQPITTTFFTSIGKPYKGIFLSLTRQILFLLPLTIILPLFMGIDGILYSGPVADFIAAACAVAMVWKEFQNMSKMS